MASSGLGEGDDTLRLPSEAVDAERNRVASLEEDRRLFAEADARRACPW